MFFAFHIHNMRSFFVCVAHKANSIGISIIMHTYYKPLGLRAKNTATKSIAFGYFVVVCYSADLMERRRKKNRNS